MTLRCESRQGGGLCVARSCQGLAYSMQEAAKIGVFVARSPSLRGAFIIRDVTVLFRQDIK